MKRILEKVKAILKDKKKALVAAGVILLAAGGVIRKWDAESVFR